MRIRKDFVNKHDGYTNQLFKRHYDDDDAYVIIGNLGATLTVLIVFALILICMLWGLFAAITFATPSSTEKAFFSRRCDLIAADKQHYVTKNDAGKTVCAVAPDWHQVGM